MHHHTSHRLSSQALTDAGLVVKLALALSAHVDSFASVSADMLVIGAWGGLGR